MPRNKKYKLDEGQLANIVLAARGESDCDIANDFVNGIDKKFKLKPKRNKKKKSRRQR